MRWVVLNQFHVSIIFIGITIVFTALISIFFDSKRSHDNKKEIEQKKKELTDIISDAEEMVSELNKFSGYIVSQIDIKNNELWESLKNYQCKLEEINQKVFDNPDIVIQSDEAALSEISCSNTIEADNSAIESPSSNTISNAVPAYTKQERILQLAQNGLNAAEIAKKMNIGKGEVQLVLELNR